MSHVDEGQLAEYLDGAAVRDSAIEQHLASCADCRALLGRVRTEREKARSILRAAGVKGSATPSFADVLERAKTIDTRKRQVRRLGRVTSLAWAATVILAIGLGWYARQLSFRTELGKAPSEADMAARRNTATVESSSVSPPAAVSTETAPKKEEQRTIEQAKAKETMPAIAIPPAAPPAPAARNDLAVAGKLAGAAPASADEAKDFAANRPELVAERSRAQAPASSVVVSQLESEPALAKAMTDPRWADTTAAAAARVLGSAPLLVAGMPVVGYAVSREGEPAVRVTQRLGDGNEIELVQRRARADVLLRAAPSPSGSRAPAMAPARGFADELDAGAGMTVQRGGYTITVKAPVSRDSLETLLARLR